MYTVDHLFPSTRDPLHPPLTDQCLINRVSCVIFHYESVFRFFLSNRFSILILGEYFSFPLSSNSNFTYHFSRDEVSYIELRATASEPNELQHANTALCEPDDLDPKQRTHPAPVSTTEQSTGTTTSLLCGHAAALSDVPWRTTSTCTSTTCYEFCPTHSACHEPAACSCS